MRFGDNLRILSAFTFFAVAAASSAGWAAYLTCRVSLEESAHRALTLGRETKRRQVEDLFARLQQESLLDAGRQSVAHSGDRAYTPTHLGVDQRDVWSCAALPDDLPTSVAARARDACASQAGNPHFSDLLHTPGTQHSFFLFNKFLQEQKEKVLVYRISTSALDRIMLAQDQWHREGFGSTGETFLVGEDFLMRSSSRFAVEDFDAFLDRQKALGRDRPTLAALASDRSVVLNLRLETDATREALAGKSGTKVLRGYRGVEVLCSYAPLNVGGQRWAILSNTDFDEAFAHVSRLRNNLMLFTGALALVFMLIGLALTKAVARPLDRLARRALGLSEDLQRRIGHDLHDDLAQQLVGTSLLAHSVSRGLDARGLAEATDVARIAALVDNAVQTTRSLARGLSPVPVLSHGLADALTQLGKDVEARAGTRVEVLLPTRHLPFPHDDALQIYRITQEAVSNALRHGQARQVVISLTVTDDECVLSVANDGIPYANTPSPDGLGTAIMAMRARTLRGVFSIRTRGDGWTEVRCRLPLSRSAE